MGKLRGINATSELRSLVKTVLALPQPTSTQNSQVKLVKSDSASSLTLTPRSALAPCPFALPKQVQEAKRGLSRLSLTAEEAKGVLENGAQSKNDKLLSGLAVISLPGVQALQYLITNSRSEPDKKTQQLQQLELAVRRTNLSFAPASTNRISSSQYQKRLERLRLQDEERSYMNLTSNLKSAASLKDDHVTAKSMMYATSVGLNMIVAPITFGAFMYFFAGSIFDRFFDDEFSDWQRKNDFDIRRVIAGVVSGVFMLFVEMLLFVIRSNELDASVRKKSMMEENRANPFGYTQKNMARNYKGD